jgi:hypothetical protein
MEDDNVNMFEALYEKVIDYAKTTFELNKLKAIEKTTYVVSSFIPHTIVFVLISFFVLSLNLGFAFWIGDALGKIAYGFFIVAGFYCITGVIIHFFFHERLKRFFGNYFLKLLFK